MKEIPDRVIERAVELWCRKLKNPTFDIGDPTLAGSFGTALATMKIEQDRAKVSDMDRRIEVFRNILTRNLKDMRDGKKAGGPYQMRRLDVDYAPCEMLREAADEAGIPHPQFSVKSAVNIDHNKVSCSFGYGSEYVYHYPLPDGRWLITTLIGSEEEMSKIFDNILNKNSLGLNVEEVK